MSQGSVIAGKRYVRIAIGLALSLLLGGCVVQGRAGPTPTPWPTPMVAEQLTYPVERGTIIDSFKLSGQVTPAVWELLSFPVDGKLALLNVSEGSNVRKGDVLAELEMKVLAEQLAQAELSLEQAQDQLDQQERTRRYALTRARENLRIQELSLQKLRESAELNRPLQLAQAEKELERARLALQKAQAAYDAISWQPSAGASAQAAALQAATFDYEIAEARYKLQVLGDAETQIALQESQVRLAQLTVQELEESASGNLERNLTKAQMQVQALERQIEERKLRAPFDGQVTAIGLNIEGLKRGFSQRPKEGDGIQAFAPLIALAQTRPLEIVVQEGSNRSGELVVGQIVTVTHSLSDHAFAARISEMPVRSLGGATPVRPPAIRISLPPDAPAMTIGDSVAIEVVGEVHADTLLLTRSAVRRFSGHNFVVVEAGGKQRRVDIRTGLENDTHIEILSGLQEGDVVVGP